MVLTLIIEHIDLILSILAFVITMLTSTFFLKDDLTDRTLIGILVTLLFVLVILWIMAAISSSYLEWG
jgi:uncharacterized membrane protein